MEHDLRTWTGSAGHSIASALTKPGRHRTRYRFDPTCVFDVFHSDRRCTVARIIITRRRWFPFEIFSFEVEATKENIQVIACFQEVSPSMPTPVSL